MTYPSSTSIGCRECHDIHAEHATVWVGDKLIWGFSTSYLSDVGKTVKVDSSENNTFHIVNNPRCPLLTPLKPAFAIGTCGQSLASHVMYFDPVEHPMNRRVNSAVSWAAVALCFLDI